MWQKRETENVISNVHSLLKELKSCSKKRDLQWGKWLHQTALETQTDSNLYVVTALMNMYAKCGCMTDARKLFNNIQKPNVVSWNVLLLGYAENGEGPVALDLFQRMKACGYVADSVTYIAAIQACTSLSANAAKGSCLRLGREIHSEVGRKLDQYVQSKLIDMYAKCGSMVEARRVFDDIEKPDVISWTALLLGYADNGEGQATLDLFSKIKTYNSCTPNSVTYVAVLKAFTSLAVNADRNAKKYFLEAGRQIHAEVGRHLDHYVTNTLIDMYVKCGSIVEARKVFDSIEMPSVVSWNVLLLGYVEHGEELAALNLFSRMKSSSCTFDSVTYIAALKACTSLAGKISSIEIEYCLDLGRSIHSEIGCHMSDRVQTMLIDMYAKCGSTLEARQLFDTIQIPDVVSWTALLLGYAENGEGVVALGLFSKMKASGCKPNPLTYVAAIKACGLIGALSLGRKFHSDINEYTPHLVTCLVDFYAKCGSIVEAREVFHFHSAARDVTTWNALISGYSSFDTGCVFSLLEEMQDQGISPDSVTFLKLLLCCSHAGLVEKAREYIEKMPFQYNVIPSSMHYNCMVDVLGRANKLDEAIEVLQTMPCDPDAMTWTALLGACYKWKNVEIGRLAFQASVYIGSNTKDVSAYVLMSHIYGSCGMLEEQEKLLSRSSG